MKDVQAILKAVDKMPPFSEAVLKAMSLLEDPEIPAGRIVEVVQYDPIITLRILQICNSAATGLRREVHSLQQALVILGNQRMIRLLVTSGALDFLDGEWGGYGLENGELWEHAMACALMSQTLLKVMEMPEDHSLFTGALLHDVGKIVLNEYVGKENKEILHRVWGLEESSLEAEREVLGIDHAQVGSLLAEKWKLPPEIVSIIGKHHDPVDPSTDPLPLCLAHLANLLSLQLGIGVGDRGLASRSAPNVIKALRWSPNSLDACISAFWSEFEQARALVGLSRAAKD